MSFHYTLWPIAAVLITACTPLDAIDGTSTSQADTERRLAVTLPVADRVEVAEITRPAALVAKLAEPCVPVFRVKVCP